MSPQTMSTPLSTAPDILAQVASANSPRPQPPQVVQALLDTERAAKHPRPAIAVESLLGQWQLRFTAPNKPAYKAGEATGKGFYWPKLAPGTIRFSRPATANQAGPESSPPDILAIENQIQLGPLALRFSGPAKFLQKQNLLAFDFVQLQVFLGQLCFLKLPIKGRAGTDNFATMPIAKLPFFAFFAATQPYLAARGRGGGLALWAKSNHGLAT